MRRWMVYASALALILPGSPAVAVWTDDRVNGTLNFEAGGLNYFDPENDRVPFGASDRQPGAVVRDADGDFVEFMALDENRNFEWEVDVDATSLHVEQSGLGAPLDAGRWDLYISGFDPDVMSITPVINTFPDLAWSLEDGGDTVHLVFPDSDTLPAGEWEAEFELDPGGIPIPGAVLLVTLGTGLVGWLRLRRAF